MLDIQTFDARAGGNVIYKALAHPLAAEAAVKFAATLQTPLAVYDPDGVASALWSMHPAMPAPASVFVHDVAQIGQMRAGIATTPLTDLPHSTCRTLLIAAFDAGKIEARIGFMIPAGMTVVSLDALKLPGDMLTQTARYLEKTNFATNYAFFRDTGEPGGSGLHTRLVTANYWAGYGSKGVRLWLRLFDERGDVLAQWEEGTPDGVGGIAIDSAEVRARFGLPAFTGQLFIHAIGAAGHDVVKYALDTYGTGDEPSLSVTHDANAWPSDRYAGMPAPRPGERVTFWLQNSHAAPIPAGTIKLDRMGAEQQIALDIELPGYASTPIDVASLLPGIAWPAQIEVRAGRHLVRPRYEVTSQGRTRIAHLNVERADLKPNPEIKSLHNLMGRGYLLPFPVLPPDRFGVSCSRRRWPRRRPTCRCAWKYSAATGANSRSGSWVTCRATTPSRSTWRSSAPKQGMPSWSTTSRMAAMPMAGCTAWSATSIASPDMRRKAASARISTTPR